MSFVTLGSIAEIQLGKMLSPKAKTGSASFPYLRNQNVQWGRIDLSSIAFMDFSIRERAKFELQSGDLLVCEGGEPGRCAIWEGQRGDFYYQKALHRVRPHEGRADSEFLSFWIRHQASIGAFDDQNAKTTIAHLPLVRLEQLAVPDKTFSEQRRIAVRLKAQLAAVEDARQAAQAQIAEVLALKESLYREIEAELFSRAELALLGDWVVSYRNGFGKRPKNGETGAIVLRIADVSTGVIKVDSPRRGQLTDKEASTYRLSVGDLLFVRVNGTKRIVGRCCVVNDQVPAGTVFNDHLIRVQLREGLNPDYACLCVALPSARSAIEEAASTSAGQLTVNQQILNGIEMPFIPLREQAVAVRRVNAQLAMIDELQQRVLHRFAEIERLPTRLLAQAFNP